MKKEIGGFESFVYYAAVILTLGGAWISKIIVKKALMEMAK